MKHEKYLTKNPNQKLTKVLLVIVFILMIIYIIIMTLRLNNTRNDNRLLVNEISAVKKENVRLNDKVTSLENQKDSIIYEFSKRMEFDRFLKVIAMRESSGNQYSINKYGMMGLYQFSPKTLKTIGMGDIDKDYYLSDENLQYISMVLYLKYNRNLLDKYIKKYDGKTFKGIKITTSGILAGAHLTGVGGVIEFFEDNKKYKDYDANGVKTSTYIKEFSGYNILDFI